MLCLPLLETASLSLRKAIGDFKSSKMSFKFEQEFDQVDLYLETHFKGISMKQFQDMKGENALKELFNHTSSPIQLYNGSRHHDQESILDFFSGYS